MPDRSASKGLRTTAEMAESWGKRYGDIRYILWTRKIEPSVIRGRMFYYDEHVQQHVLGILKSYDTRPKAVTRSKNEEIRHLKLELIACRVRIESLERQRPHS